MVIIMLMKAILRKVYDDLFPSVAALPGVARLVHHLAKHQVRNSNFNHHIPSPLVADVYTRISNLYLILGLHCKACSSTCKTSGPCQQHLSLSIIFCAFCLVADVNTRVSNPISYTWVAIQGLSNTLKPADPPALYRYKCKYRQGANKAPSLV